MAKRHAVSIATLLRAHNVLNAVRVGEPSSFGSYHLSLAWTPYAGRRKRGGNAVESTETSFGAADAGPVFIGGCDRSGTTLLGSIIGAHPRFIVTPESPFKTEIASRVPFGAPEEGAATVDEIMNSWRFKLWRYDFRPSSQPSTYEEAISDLVASYAVAAGRPKNSRWVDHTPNNVRYARRLLKRFEDSKFIHMVRDGRAICASVIPLDWGPNTPLVAAQWWAERLSYGLAAELRLGPSRVLRVHYENLVTDPESELRRVFEFLGSPFSDEALASPVSIKPAYTVGQHSLIGKPIDVRRLNAFRDELSKRSIELFEWSTGDLLEYLGYELDFSGIAIGPNRRERMATSVHEFVGRQLNRYRNNRRRRRGLNT